MTPAPGDSVNLAGVLSALTARKVRIGEIIAALAVGRSTYYEQRDEGRLVSADNLLRLAAGLDLNPVELLLRCGLISPESVVDCAGKVGTGVRHRRPRRRPDTRL